MKYVRYIVLILFVVIVTGCTAEYNIKIDKDFIEENSFIRNSDKSTWDNDDYLYGESFIDKIKETLEIPRQVYTDADVNFYDEYSKTDGVDYYEQSIISTSKEYGLKYNFKFPIDKYSKSLNSNICYDVISVANSKEKIILNTSDSFNCFDNFSKLDEVTVNITTSWNYSVISSNADKVENGKYTWIITKDNASNKPIRIELKKVFNWKLTLVILIPTLVVATISYFIIKKKVAKNNQI